MTVTSAGSSTSLAQLRQLQQAAFKTADADGDGQLSLTEFQSIGQNVQGAEGQQGPPPMRGSGGPGQHFKGDTLSSLLSTQSVDDLTSSLLKAGDADGDGERAEGDEQREGGEVVRLHGGAPCGRGCSCDARRRARGAACRATPPP